MRFVDEDLNKDLKMTLLKVKRYFYLLKNLEMLQMDSNEREVLRYLNQSNANTSRVSDLQLHLRITRYSTYKVLSNMADKGWILPVGESDKRICKYKLNMSHNEVKCFFAND